MDSLRVTATYTAGFSYIYEVRDQSDRLAGYVLSSGDLEKAAYKDAGGDDIDPGSPEAIALRAAVEA